MIKPSIHDIGSWPACLRRFDKEPAEASSFVFYLNRLGRVVGILETEVFNGRRGFIVHVAPRYRRRGIATNLLEDALARWPDLDLEGDLYTIAGAAWINKFLEERKDAR